MPARGLHVADPLQPHRLPPDGDQVGVGGEEHGWKDGERGGVEVHARVFVCGGECKGKRSREDKEVKIASALLADDTAIMVTKGDTYESVRKVEEGMDKWEERNTEVKEERLEVGIEEGEGCYGV